MRVWELERAADLLATGDPRIEPGGPMAPFLGPQLSQQAIAQAYEARHDGTSQLSPAVIRAIRVFPVPCLANASVRCGPAQFCAAVRSLLVARLQGTSWPERWFAGLSSEGLIEKYQLVDASYPAPMDPATNQRMVIELGGRIAGDDGPLAPGDPLPERVAVTISQAHWSNVSGLGLGVGFYL